MIIVSGLERSGTSLMMQILENAGYDVIYDDTRKPDINNPNGYYELNDGKIIYELMENRFDKSKYKDKVIKITAFGLPMVEGNDHKVIYMIRNIDEVVLSQNKMIKRNFKPHQEIKTILRKLNKENFKYLNNSNINTVYINYNDLMTNPKKEIKKLSNFLGKDVSSSISVIDKKLYRNRRN